MASKNVPLKPVQFAALMLYALVLGVFWGTWFAQSRTMDTLSAATFLENGRMYIANLAMPMRFLMPSCLAATFLAAYLARGRGPAASYGTLAAGILMMAALAVTLGVNVPLDFQFKSWSLETLPPDWERLRDRWETFHRLRTWLSIGGFAALAGAVLATRD